MAETPSSYKRFAQSDKISQGITNAALSLNDYLPGQHVTGPNNNDIAATLAQVQAIPIGTATLSGNTYNVTISNYPNTATIYPGQKISVKFNADAPTADDTALNLSAFGQSLPLCARGVRMGQGAIKSGMILELVYRGDMWNADYDVVKANRDANGYTTFADGQSVYNKQSVDGIVARKMTKIVTLSWAGGSTTPYVPFVTAILDLSGCNHVYAVTPRYKGGGSYADRCLPMVVGMTEQPKKYYIGAYSDYAYNNPFTNVDVHCDILYD